MLCDECPFEPELVEKAEDKIVDKEISCTFLGNIIIIALHYKPELC